MKTLYEQIKYALQEDIDNNELLRLKDKIKASLDIIGSRTYSIASGNSARPIMNSCDDLATYLSIIVEKLVELENKIEELDNRGM